MRPGILPEHGFKHKGNHYATLSWFGTKMAQKQAKRIKTKTWSAHVFVATFSHSHLQGNVRSQRIVHAQWRLERNNTFPIARRQAGDVCCLKGEFHGSAHARILTGLCTLSGTGPGFLLFMNQSWASYLILNANSPKIINRRINCTGQH